MLFGGCNDVQALQLNNEVWLIRSDSDCWDRMLPTGTAPVPRRQHASVFDSRRNRMLVIGGANAIGTRFNDVWALSLSGAPEWTQILPTGTPPSTRYAHSAVYDSTRDRVVIFGGATPAVNAEVWLLWLGGTPRWEQLVLTGPLGRHSHMAMFDPVRDRMLVYGGYRSVARTDLWALEFTGTVRWVQLAAIAAAGPRYGAASAYARGADRWIISGGEPSSGALTQWSLTLASNAWTDQSPASPDFLRNAPYPATCWAPTTGELLLLGGVGTSYIESRTWRFAMEPALAWDLVLDPGLDPPSPLEQVPRRSGASMVFDVPGRRYVLLPGFGTPTIPDVYEFQVGRDSFWVLRPEMRAPIPRSSYGLAFDSTRDRWLLFGGSVFGGSLQNDLWEFRLRPTPSWTQILPTGPMSLRQSPSLIYDPSRDRIILFGGFTTDGRANDLWELSLSAPASGWAAMASTGSPPAEMSDHTALYDLAFDRMVVFGGNDWNGYSDRTWTLSLSGVPHWTLHTPSGPVPPGRAGHSMVWDPTRHRALVFGGNGAGGLLNDSWSLNLGAQEPSWSQELPFGALPETRSGHAAAYDPLGDRMLIKGGWNGSSLTLGDTWRLEIQDLPTATGASLISSSASQDEVKLRWDASGLLGLDVRVERRAATSAWRVVRQETVSGAGVVEYRDREVSPGDRFAYRLAYRDGSVERSSSEIWVDVPAATSFSVQGFRPNPTPGVPRIAFQVDRSGPVRLQLFDLAGRRVFACERNLDTPGHAVVEVSRGELLPAGVYLIQVEQHGRIASRSAVLIR